MLSGATGKITERCACGLRINSECGIRNAELALRYRRGRKCGMRNWHQLMKM